MPASRSPKPRSNPVAPKRSYGPLIAIGLAAVIGVVVTALPASIITHFLPPIVHAEDFSGSIWHGSAGRITLNGRDAGAFEWRLHPAALLTLSVAADVHWVKIGLLIDASVEVDRHGFKAHDVKGGGPIENLGDLGLATGWRGSAVVDFSELAGDFTRVSAVAGHLRVANLSAAQIAAGADLGGYDLNFGPGAVDADGNIAAQLRDTGGGPLDVQALVHYSAREHTGLLTGTVHEHPDAPAALVNQLGSFAQLRGRDPQGRIPVDLEFAL
jgi:hypothetical protein